MIRPNTRELLRDKSANEAIVLLEEFILTEPNSELYLAKIDLLRMYGKNNQREKFYALALYLVSSINNAAVYREVARFAYFIDLDKNTAMLYAKKAIAINKKEPLWVYYIAREPKSYFEKIYDGVYLTAIPKNASTSLKTMVLEKLHNKTDLNPHSVFGNPFFETNENELKFKEGDLKLLSTREPVERFLSYYNKNIIEESSLKEELNFTSKEQEFGLSLKPELDYFVKNLNKYCYAFNDVLHHILPQTAYFSNASVYDIIAELKNSNDLALAISKKVGVELAVPKKMVSKKKISNIELSPLIREVIETLYYDDLAFVDNNLSYERKFSFDFGAVNE